VLYAVSLADEVLVIATPEPTALADAYATIKLLGLQQGRTSTLLVVNQTQRAGEGRHVATQLQAVIHRFVQLPGGGSINLQPLGDIPHDLAVRQAVQKRQLLMLAHAGSDAARAIGEIAARLVAVTTPGPGAASAAGAGAGLQSGR